MTEFSAVFNMNTRYTDKEIQKRLKLIRLLKMVILVLVLVVSLLLCTVWVLYVQITIEDGPVSGYREFCCSPSNITCLTLLCPSGMKREMKDENDVETKLGTVFSGEYDECLVPSHFTCCTNTDNIFLCYQPGGQQEKTNNCVRVSYNGVLFTGHDQFCREGYIWVPWKRKCFRQDNSST